MVNTLPIVVSIRGGLETAYGPDATPALTTVDVSAGMLAQRAAQLIVHMQRNEGESPINTPLTMKPELVIRSSVARI